MAKKTIYSGPSYGLYRPHQFLLFMDQGYSGSHRRPVELLHFKWGTTLVHVQSAAEKQVWHVHHYGVTVQYVQEKITTTVRLFGEDVPLNQHSLRNPPISEVERIILQEAENPKYACIEG